MEIGPRHTAEVRPIHQQLFPTRAVRPHNCISCQMLEYSSLEKTSKWRNITAPPGYSSTVSNKGKSKHGKDTDVAVPSKSKALAKANYETLKAKRAWDLAISPAKQLPMQMVMVYFSGGGVQIFSMGMVAMLLSSPFKALASINEAFAAFAPEESTNPRSFSTLLLQKLAYVFCNLLVVLVGAWKCHQMGLLPVGTGDWLAFETRKESPEISFY